MVEVLGLTYDHRLTMKNIRRVLIKKTAMHGIVWSMGVASIEYKISNRIKIRFIATSKTNHMIYMDIETI